MPSSFDDMLRALEQLVDLTGQNLAETQALRQEIASLRETQAEAGSRAGSGEGPGEGFGSGAPSSPSPLGEQGGGLLDTLGAGASKFGGAAAALAAGATAAAVGRGVVSGFEGGTAADFAGGLSAGISDVLARVPVLGELTGASGQQRVNRAVAGSQGVSGLRELAAAGGEIDDQLLDQVVGFEQQRARRGEAFDRRLGRRLERETLDESQGFLRNASRFGTLPGLLGIDVPGAASEAIRSLHMQINTSGIHTQK